MFFKCIDDYGKSIVGGKPKIDKNAVYVVSGVSLDFPDHVIIRRLDGDKYEGHTSWVVPFTSLILFE